MSHYYCERFSDKSHQAAVSFKSITITVWCKEQGNWDRADIVSPLFTVTPWQGHKLYFPGSKLFMEFAVEKLKQQYGCN